jgi:uncharacterized transporter YbjL
VNEMADEQRKATDILIALETKVDNLIKTIAVYDHTSKMMLDRINFVYNYIKNFDNNTQQDVPDNKPITITNEHIITETEIPRIAARQVPQQTSTSDKKVPVVQRITNSAGKDLFMAEVSVMNINKELVFKTKTNAVGKWMANLKPDKYIVNIVKTDTATKKKFETTQEINVVNSNSVITLPVMMIK